MINWKEIEELPKDLTVGSKFLFCTLSKHIHHVMLVICNGDSFCWAVDGQGAEASLLLDSEMAMVTHFAVPNLPESTERQLTALAIRVANLDGRPHAYEHDKYGR